MPSLLGLSFHRKKTHSSSQLSLASGATAEQERGHGRSSPSSGSPNSHHHNNNSNNSSNKPHHTESFTHSVAAFLEPGHNFTPSSGHSDRRGTTVTAVTAAGPVQSVSASTQQLLHDNGSSNNHSHNANGSCANPHQQSQQHKLTRFFRPGMKKRPSGGSLMSSTKLTDLISPDQTNNLDHNSHAFSAIPPSTDSTLSLSNKTNIYHDDSILAQKYGKLGKVLGSGAGGSVKVLVRPSDGAMFAVKQFRSRKPNEPIRDYARKCTSEFCVGSMLHHPNIIETLDIFSDAKQTQYYQVMEYCPVDFFAVVMSGEMSRGEINCCFKQLVEAVNYLHSKGYAHRDLKLDNCVMTKEGILKLIDFGSAFVYKYTYENDTKLAHGIVGSDPYLAPEVLVHSNGYDAPMVDIWSMGIIFCCMMLKRFPWKVPKDSDVNFSLYCMPDDVEHDYVKSAQEHEALMKTKREERQKVKQMKDSKPREITEEAPQHREHEEHGSSSTQVNQITSTPEQKTEVVEKKASQVTHEEPINPKADPTSSEYQVPQRKQKKVIHGPYRLLRLLPHASRPIMSKILEVNPAQRATMKDIYADGWFANIPYCTLDDKKNVIRGAGHSHTIVTEENAHLEKYKV
ncbi:putative serine/threonine protein kinase HRK1 [Kluyveromyces lactis]|uniref:non-specific serine/threonine protein kinase n=1 Tax=Kluyveromyces lactis (strain ATCC 8585 / CBS 2359 / DSM 70799 / NBRC 1267 / NRRL Y-1140 / WM37) TaxID=284590 RepID=Q6CU54_KLULA|nr:uncharacterized protein KLLA0_C07535g [Kluyveromyces lactis]CAH01386.1 KLLA0C07535p [Kluyveromyces lactis]|eukprot:XP_452535.1 uncharacterized protein KLLA0_C07535g [Kluyveromyces lactis]